MPKNNSGVTVIIPTRSEPYLLWTIRNLARVRGVTPMEIIIINDGGEDPRPILGEWPSAGALQVTVIDTPPLGLCKARHAGIEIAQFEAIFVIDAHMDFQYKMFDYFPAYVEANHKRLSCCKMVGLEMTGCGESAKGEWSTSEYYGATINLKDNAPSYKRRRIFASEWTKSQDLRENWRDGQFEEIQSILGASYVFSRDWYFEIGAPWEHLNGWGTSEQNISIPNWLFGGSCYLMPFQCAHWSRTVGIPQQEHVIISNQLRLLRIIPMDSDEQLGLFNYLTEKMTVHDALAANGLANASYPEVYRDKITREAPRTWVDYKRRWWPDE